MANILISYADERYCESLKRLKREAKSLGCFDKIIVYTPKDLPLSIKASPLFAYTKGGGYWLWKPYIIYRTLQKCVYGDVVYYVDAGCRLNGGSKEWNLYSELIREHDAIFFQYRSDFDYGWARKCSAPQNDSPKIKHWTKPLTVDYFRKYFGETSFLDYNKIWGGAMVIKKTRDNTIVNEWLNIELFHPELVVDPYGEELSRLPDTFNAHRHDQTILTPLVYYYKDKQNILVLPETSESQQQTAAIVAERWIQGKMPFLLAMKTKIHRLIHNN